MPDLSPDDLFRGLDPEVKKRFQGEVAQQETFLEQVTPRVATQPTSIIGPGVYTPKTKFTAYNNPGRPAGDISIKELETRHRLNADPGQTASILRQAGVLSFTQALHWLDDADEAWKVTAGRVPDKEAKIQFYAKLLPPGLDEDFVRDNFDAVERDFLYRDFRELVKDSKALGEWAADPNNIIVAWDSGRQLSALKNVLVSRYGGVGEHIGVGFENALESPAKGVLGAWKLADDVSNWQFRKLLEISAGKEFTPKEEAELDKRMSHVSNTYFLSLLGSADARKEMDRMEGMSPAELNTYLAGRQDVLAAKIRTGRETAAVLTDEVSGFYRFGVDLPGSAADLLSKVAMGVINPAIPLGLIGLQEGGGLYGDLRDEGISSGTALSVSVPVATINVLLERAQLKNVRNILGIRARMSKESTGALVRELLGNVVENIGQETVQNMVTTAGTLAARTEIEDTTAKKVLNEMFGSLKEGLYEGLLVGTTSAILGIGSVSSGMRRIAVNAKQRAALGVIADDLDKMPLYARDPKKTQQAIDAMLAGENPNTVIRDVGLDAETFQQMVPEAIQEETLKALGIDGETYQQALVENEEMRFTIGAWATVAPTQIGTQLFNHLRFGAEGMTVVEQQQAVEFEAEIATDRALIVRDMLTLNTEGMTPQQKMAFRAQFEETGMPAGFARDYVEQLDRVLKRGAAIKGVPTAELAERVRFTIDADPTRLVEGEAVLEQADRETVAEGTQYQEQKRLYAAERKPGEQFREAPVTADDLENAAAIAETLEDGDFIDGGTLDEEYVVEGRSIHWRNADGTAGDFVTSQKSRTAREIIVHARVTRKRHGAKPELANRQQAAVDHGNTINQIGPGAQAGLAVDAASGDVVFNNEEAAQGLAQDPTTEGDVFYQGVTVPHEGRYLRGKEAKTGLDAVETLAENLTDADIIEYDDAKTVEEAKVRADSYEYLEPNVRRGKKKLRYTAKPGEYYGNKKMAFPSDAYPKGRNSWDIPGCGRKAWALENGQSLSKACYDGSCYAEAIKIGKQGKVAGVTAGIDKKPVVGDERKGVEESYRDLGLAETERLYPQFEIKEIFEKGEFKKLSVGKYVDAAGNDVTPEVALGGEFAVAAVVSTDLQPAKGQDIRLGIDTDGAAWLARSDVMDAILEANPRTVTVYSSAYHKPPEAHPLSGRTMINVTVSGWHPLVETMSRLRWAEEARANGWNVILREVVADPAIFGEETAKVYNRLHEALLKTDFFVMQQPLHVGKKHGEPMWGLPACCKGSKKNPHTCDQCEVNEGLGKKFTDYWGIAETDAKEEQIFPDLGPRTYAQVGVSVGGVDPSVSFATLDVPPENTAFTQITTTVGTYRAAGEKLKTLGLSEGTVLDFGAGKGAGTKELGSQAESFEPFPGEDYEPDYTDVPKKKYEAVVSLNVLNVLPPAERQVVIENIGKVLRVGGTALIGTRGREVARAKSKTAVAEDPGGFIVQPDTDRRRYQKGFTSQTLTAEVQAVLGAEYEVTTTKIGSIPAAVQVKRLTAAETRERAVTFAQELRGAVTFTGQDIEVRLFQGNWDTSTPIHELGHIALKFVQEAVEAGTASAEVLAEYEALKKFAGGEFTVEGIEKIINEWEAYFMEGKAPAVDLAEPFAHFKNWMLDIYHTVADKLGGREAVAPEMRQVFNAWIATEREVEVAETYYRTYEAASDVLLKEKDAKLEKAKDRVEDEKEKKIREAVKERLKEWRDQTGGRTGILAQATAEIDALPVYQAVGEAIDLGGLVQDDIAAFFTGSDVSQMVDELRAAHGQTVVSADEKPPLDRSLEAYLDWMTDVARKSQLEVLAEKHGFDDPRELVITMKDSVSRDQAIENRANEIEARHVRNVKADVEVEAGATHSEATLQLIQRDIARLEALERGRQSAQLLRAKRKAIRDQVRDELRTSLDARDAMQYRRWAAREAEQARKALTAARRGDAKATLDAKKKQFKYHAAIVESVALREHYEKVRRGLAGKTIESRLKNTEPDYARAVRDLVFSYRANDTTTPQTRGITIKVDVVEGQKRFTVIDEREAEVLGVFASRGEALAAWRNVVRQQPLELPTLGLTKKEDADLQGLLVDLDDTVPTWVKEKVIPAGYVNMKDLTFEQIDELNASIQMMLHEGGQYLNALKQLGVERVGQLVDKIDARMEKLPEFHKGKRDATTFLGKASAVSDKFAAYMTRMEFLFDAMDGYTSLKGEKTGPSGLIYDLVSLADAAYDNIIAKHMQGDDKIPGLQQAYVRLAKAAEKIHAERGDFFDVKGVPIPQQLRQIKGWESWTFERVLAVVFNMGNDANRGPLQKSVYQFTDAQLEALASVLPADALRAVQDVWDSIDVYDDLAKVSEAVTFKKPPREEPQPFTAVSSEGERVYMKGGYYPLRYDSSLDPDAGRWNERSNILADLYNRSTHQSARPDSTAAKARVRDEQTGESLSTRPPDLSLGVLVDRFTKTVRQITHTELLYDLQRLTTNRDFYDTFVKKFGLAQYKAMRQWLNRTARPERKIQGPLNRVIESLRSLHTVSALGLRIITSSKQALSSANAVQSMNDGAGNLSGYKYLAYGASTLLTGDENMGKSPGKIIEFINKVDPFMKARMQSISREMRDFTRNINFARGGFLNKVKRTKQWAQEVSFVGIRAVDAVTTYSVWLGAYKQALELGLGGVAEATDEAGVQEAAVRYARKVVRTTQPSGMPSDQSGIQAEEGVARLFTQFMSFKNVDFNRFMHRVAGIKRGQVSAKTLAGYVFNERLLPAMAMLIPAFLFYNEDEKPKWWEFMMQPGTDLLAGVPLLNQMIRAFEFRSELPILQGVTRARDATSKFRRGKVGEGAFEAWRTLEWFTGVPFTNPVTDAKKLYRKTKSKEK